jgi:integrase
MAVSDPTFRMMADAWWSEKGSGLATAKDDGYRLNRICRFPIQPNATLGDMVLKEIQARDILAFREFRRTAGVSAVTRNHDIKLLRKIFNFAVIRGELPKTPFRTGHLAVIGLEQETPRSKRFYQQDDEARLLASANPHLRAIIIAMLDTGCRPGEILSLQWSDVSLERREFVVIAAKAKTRRERVVPVSRRLLDVLQERRLNSHGNAWPLNAFVFGNHAGERSRCVRTAWQAACRRAGINSLQLRDLRHEAGSRFDETGVPIHQVSRLLGHTSLATTTRYLNVQRESLHAAVARLETHLATSIAQTLHMRGPDGQSGAHGMIDPTSSQTVDQSRDLNLVRKRGLEPPLDCSNKLLRLARLPIPPLPQW